MATGTGTGPPGGWGDLGGLTGHRPCAAASSTSTPRAPACRTWPRCGPTTRGSLTSTVLASCAGDRPPTSSPARCPGRSQRQEQHRPLQPFLGGPHGPTCTPCRLAIKTPKRLVILTCILWRDTHWGTGLGVGDPCSWLSLPKENKQKHLLAGTHDRKHRGKHTD